MKRIRFPVIAALAIAAILFAIRIAWPPTPPEAHELLREVYSPRPGPVPPLRPAGETLSVMRDLLHGPAAETFLQRWLPSQGGTLWLCLLVMVAIGFDFERVRHRRNLDLLAIQILGLLFFDIMFFPRHLGSAYWVSLIWWIFNAIVAVELFLAIRAVWRVSHPFKDVFRPALRGRALAALAILTLGLDVAAAAVRFPDDAGFFVNLGAQRLRERGLLPYGDPLLTHTPGAAYGPLLYVAHVPFQLLVDPVHLNPVSTPLPPLGNDSTYRLPSPLATKLCTIAFQLLAAAALFAAGRRLASTEIGLSLVALYCGSTFVIGMGGEDYYIGGMTFVSHIAPPALTTAAFAALARPAWAGSLLVAAAGCGFYPAFLLPAWIGYYWGRRRELISFLVATTISAALIGGFVLARSRPAGGRGLIGTILWDTLGHHTDPAGYGSSPFGFWGQRPGLLGWLNHPLVGSSALTAPVMLAFIVFAGICFFLARGKSPQALALISAAVVIGATLVKIHSTGSYVAWFYPFLLLGLFLPPGTAEQEPPVATRDSRRRFL